MRPVSPDDIDAVLPQTQCGLCGYPGCMPYAEAIVFEGAAINLCPPGGVKTLRTLGTLLNQDPSPYIPAMEKQTKPSMRAVIREDECIGCTKCIPACPVDVILGSAKQMHTIIANECTGCELCISACPVDCIDLLALGNDSETYHPEQARQRYNAKQKRAAVEKSVKKAKQSSLETQRYVENAVARAKQKKSSS